VAVQTVASNQFTTPPHPGPRTLIHPTGTHPTVLLLPYPFLSFLLPDPDLPGGARRARPAWNGGTRPERARPAGSGDAWHPVKLPARSSGDPFDLPRYDPSRAARGPRRGGRRARRPRRGAAHGGGRTLQVRDRLRPQRSCGHGPLPRHCVAIGFRLHRDSPPQVRRQRMAVRLKHLGICFWGRRGGRALRHPHGRAATACRFLSSVPLCALVDFFFNFKSQALMIWSRLPLATIDMLW
jgi:hypothetical protein